MIIKFWGQKIIIISICTITTKGITQHIKDTFSSYMTSCDIRSIVHGSERIY